MLNWKDGRLARPGGTPTAPQAKSQPTKLFILGAQREKGQTAGGVLRIEGILLHPPGPRGHARACAGERPVDESERADGRRATGRSRARARVGGVALDNDVYTTFSTDYNLLNIKPTQRTEPDPPPRLTREWYHRTHGMR